MTNTHMTPKKHCIESCYCAVRESRLTVLLIVFLSLFVDFLLLTLVDPILPSILSQVDGIELGANSSIDQIHLINHNGRYGYLAAAKGAAQFVLNPVIGILVSKIGYRKPMLVGASLLALSTVVFAYSTSYAELFVSRIFQGISSAITAITGMALVASSSYADAEERSRHMAIAVGGISLGATVGPVYGSLLYEFVGQKTPFLILAAVIAVVIVLQVITMRDEEQIKQHSPALSFVRLLCDPLILIVAGNILLVNLQFALLANFLPLRLIKMKYTATWQLGLAILPNTIGYLFACVASLKIPNFPKWLRTFVGLILSIPSLVMIAYLNNIVGLLVAVGFIGVGTGLVSASSQPILAHLVDVRHNSVYGCVYAISDMSVCLANFVGPLIGGIVIFHVNFDWLMYGAALLTSGFVWFSILLRKASNDLVMAGTEESLLITHKTAQTP